MIGKSKEIEYPNALAIIFFLFGVIGLIAVIVFDKLYWNRGPFAEGVPEFSASYVVRSLIVLTLVITVVWGLIQGRKPRLILAKRAEFSLEHLTILCSLFVSVALLSLFTFIPSVFSTLSIEDGPIEWGSAILLFGGCLILGLSLIVRRRALTGSKAIQCFLALFSFLLFVMAMEEISWFQRVLDFETPGAFEGNLQDEINFHNFATNKIENLYYFSTFLFLVALPFLRVLLSFLASNELLRIVVPRPFVAVVASIAYAYNFDMWNIIFTQIAFFGSVAILFSIAIFCTHRIERYLVFSVIIITVASQLVFLINGNDFDRIWEVTEYKEFLIPLALLVYSWDVSAEVNSVEFRQRT